MSWSMEFGVCAVEVVDAWPYLSVVLFGMVAWRGFPWGSYFWY